MEVVVKKKKKGVQYFTQDTEDAIVLYNHTEDSEERSRIYRERIHYGFFKLTENIIHTFKFYYTEVDNIEDLQHEVITFLLSKIHTENIFEIFPKEYDAQIADAILELFRKRENLDVFNKKALYIYIREQVDVKTPKITKIANQLYDIFKENYVFYLEHGYTNF